MAIQGIPTPKLSGEILSTIPESMMQMMLARAQQEQAQAQAQQSRAKAGELGVKSSILQSLMSGAPMPGMQGGGQQPGEQQPTQAGQSSTGGMSKERALALASMLGLKTETQDGQLITPFGSFKVGESASEKRTGEAEAAAAKKTSEKIAEGLENNARIKASLSGLDQIMQNPKYKDTPLWKNYGFGAGNVMGIPVGAIMQKQFPEEAELYGKANVYFADILSGFTSKFKGSTSKQIVNLANTLKPSPTDSYEVKKGKIQSLKVLDMIGDKYAELYDQYVNKDKMSPIAAQIKASKELPYSQIQKEVEEAGKATNEFNQQPSMQDKEVNEKPKQKVSSEQMKKWLQEARDAQIDENAINEMMKDFEVV